MNDGEITVLVGPNGSGKSTLLKTIMGITDLYSGGVFYDGTKINGLPTHEITKLGIAYLPQVNSTFSNLTVRENLVMAGYVLGKEEADERVRKALEDFPVLKGYASRKAATLSGGERQMLAMAMALTRKPKVMLFDEPTASLSPKVALEVLGEIRALKEERGMTIVLAEQNARRALEMGDRAILLVGGKVAYEGSSKELLEHKELGRVYLGIGQG
ncbi:MAG: ABC transporter ATP-binding protein [Candidatus Brockarchaeota archaeon]|nr:ABC transporter ATP-binding protein [Candidatus Brockarchaeota archaeon]